MRQLRTGPADHQFGKEQLGFGVSGTVFRGKVPT